jgi:lysophospholipid acyltransferase (LPLAT)-like uncharacterized protein
MARIRISPQRAGWLISLVMKGLAMTWRWRLDDRGGWLNRPMPGPPILWVVWHNRIGMAPQMYWKWFRRQPVAVLTSASKDGEVLAETCRHFTMESARGSSSRRGAQALRECLGYIKKDETSASRRTARAGRGTGCSRASSNSPAIPALRCCRCI